MEEVAAGEECQGRGAATLEVVMEAAGPLTCGQLEGLEAPTTQAASPPLEAGPSQLYISAVAQLPMMVLS